MHSISPSATRSDKQRHRFSKACISFFEEEIAKYVDKLLPNRRKLVILFNETPGITHIPLYGVALRLKTITSRRPYRLRPPAPDRGRRRESGEGRRRTSAPTFRIGSSRLNTSALIAIFLTQGEWKICADTKLSISHKRPCCPLKNRFYMIPPTLPAGTKRAAGMHLKCSTTGCTPLPKS